jgi:hypothetical protein
MHLMACKGKQGTAASPQMHKSPLAGLEWSAIREMDRCQLSANAS